MMQSFNIHFHVLGTLHKSCLERSVIDTGSCNMIEGYFVDWMYLLCYLFLVLNRNDNLNAGELLSDSCSCIHLFHHDSNIHVVAECKELFEVEAGVVHINESSDMNFRWLNFLQSLCQFQKQYFHLRRMIME